MQSLDFAAIRRVEQALASVALDDLVAVFSQTSGERLLLVYNTATCPAITIDTCEAIRLDELREADLESYDGLLAGISALDVIRDDLVTKGPGFYPLERIVLRLKPRSTLHSTLRNLARYLVTLLDNLFELDVVPRQRAESKIVQLALPGLLDERGAEGLVAVLSGPELSSFVEGQGGEWLNVADDLSVPAMPHRDGWIIAMEELCKFNPQIDPDTERFIELRDVLRQAGYTEALRQTCRALAGRCVEAATKRPQLWRSAWELISEAWLMDEDVEELMAFFPHADFEHFAETGEGLRVYRTLAAEAVSIMPGPRCAISDFEQHSVPGEFQRYCFSVVPLHVLIRNTARRIEQADLGWLLWKAGHDAALTRTLVLLARDKLEDDRGNSEWSSKIVSDLARRAMLLISMGDPWALRQGRYAQLLSSAYEILRSALQLHAEADRKIWYHYFEGLTHWYGCYNQQDKQDVEDSLHQMVHSLRTFLRDSRHEVDEFTSRYRQIAEQLIGAAEATLYPLAIVHPEKRGDQRPDYRYQWRKRLARSIELNLYPPYVSPIFDRVMGSLIHMREERQQLLMYEHDVDVLRHKLIAILNSAKRQRKLIFAPPHEMVVLRFICDSEMTVVEERLRELGTTRLAIIPVNDRIEHLKEVRLTFEVRNTGRVETNDIELVLTPNLTFELKDHSSVREFPHLAPGESQHFSYQVRALHASEATFDFSYGYEGQGESQTTSIRLPVRSLDEAPFEMKSDKYNFGRFIENPDDFYGRETEINNLLASLHGGGQTNFLLRGPRRMGKTSLLFMLKHTLEKPDLRRRFGISEGWDSILDRYRPVIVDLQGFRLQDDSTHTRRFFYALLDAISTAIAPDLRDELLRSFDKRFAEVEARRAVLDQLAEVFRLHPQVRVVVLLDEYDELYRPQGRDLDTALRYVVQHGRHLTWIIASTLLIFKESKSYGSPWFNILNTIELGCLSREAAQRLVEEPSKEEGIEWQSDATVALLEETGRHPAFLQLFCSRIIAHLNEQRQNYVRPETIHLLAEQIIQEREIIHTHFEFYWTGTPGVGQLILLVADESDRSLSWSALWSRVQAQLQLRFGSKSEARIRDANDKIIPWSEQEFKDGMVWVSDVVNAISFDRVSRTYTFTVPLFRRWLQHKRRYEDLREAALNSVAIKMEQDGVA